VAGKTRYRINQSISASKLRVIDQDGKQIGILTRIKALKKAKEENLDLVEVAPKASPPVAKLIDFKKFLYLEQKKRRKEKRKKGGETKGIRLTPFIAEADFNVKARRAEKFLKEGNKIRVEVRFKGRQMGSKKAGYELLSKFAKTLEEKAKIEQEPRWFGRSLVSTFTPTKQESKNGQEKKGKSKNKKVG